jgi:catechol 2,3-dioxygenase-like lactoylglutathione lyase family enzyme
VSGSLALGSPVQIAYAVPDAEAAATRWSAEVGAGPFFLRRHIPVVDVIHRHRPARFDHSSAYGQWGDVMVELVQDHGDGPSVVRDMYAPDESGLHHLAFIVDDLDASLRSLLDRGYELAQSGRTPGGVEFHFVDTVVTHGHMLELYPRSARLLEFFEMVRRASVGWNGSDPVRQL